jgi:hypothetical protein
MAQIGEVIYPVRIAISQITGVDNLLIGDLIFMSKASNIMATDNKTIYT